MWAKVMKNPLAPKREIINWLKGRRRKVRQTH